MLTSCKSSAKSSGPPSTPTREPDGRIGERPRLARLFACRRGSIASEITRAGPGGASPLSPFALISFRGAAVPREGGLQPRRSPAAFLLANAPATLGQSVAEPNALPAPSPACWHLLELITAVVVVVVRRGGYNEEAPVMTVVTELTPSGAPVAAKVPNARSTKAANAGTHTASAEPADKGGTV